MEQLDLFLMSNQGEITNRKETKEQENKVEIKNPLSERQKALYRLIRRNSMELKRKTTQKEICYVLKEYGYVWNDDTKAHDHCTMIWSDIAVINESVETRKLIISKNFEYWLGSERENQEFINGLWKALSPRLHRYWTYLNKTKQNGQYTMIDANGKVIDESSKAQKFIQAFLDYDIEMQQVVNKDE